MTSIPTTTAVDPSRNGERPTGAFVAPERKQLINRVFSTLLSVAVLVLLVIPLLGFSDDLYWMPKFSKFAALAILALGVDLIWGYTGLLSLGQGLYFGLGAYAMGYYLKFIASAREAGDPVGTASLPDFMFYSRLPAVPFWLAPLANFYVAMAVAILLPVLIAGLFGAITFRLRIKGVYFSLITQALVLAVFTFVVNQLAYTNGVNGLNNLAKFELFGSRLDHVQMYYLTAGILVLCYFGCVWLMISRFGKVLTAIRDSETRVLALGYNTAMYKTFIFALAAGLSGLSGALYVAANSPSACSPNYLGVAFSIEVVILVAVGGRGTLIGAILGTLLVKVAETYVNDKYPKFWQIFLGMIFILVVVFLPEGIIGLLRKWLTRLTGMLGGRQAEPGAKPAAATLRSGAAAPSST